jgi:hypothetical protein
MRHLLHSVRNAVKQENWYAALTLALAMPDMCGLMSNPQWKNSSKKRSVDFFDKYLSNIYRTGPMGTQAMTGGDFYALRCAYLHQGEFDLDGQSAAETLALFQINSPKNSQSHLNVSYVQAPDGTLSLGNIQLRVDAFCEEICVAVEQWLSDNANDVRIQTEIACIATIHDDMRLDFPAV